MRISEIKRLLKEKSEKEVIQEVYESRKSRITHPNGSFDKAGRWDPDETEFQDCCRYIRKPSRTYPYSLLKHCRSKKHIRNLVKSLKGGD